MSNYNMNRKGQISETITWVISTIIIIFILVASIYISSILGETKTLEKKKIFVSDEDVWINEKNNYAFSLNGANKEEIIIWLEESDTDG